MITGISSVSESGDGWLVIGVGCSVRVHLSPITHDLSPITSSSTVLVRGIARCIDENILPEEAASLFERERPGAAHVQVQADFPCHADAAMNLW